MKNFIKWMASFVLATVLGGCASVQMASVDDDARAKSQGAPAGKALLFVYRNETFGAAVPLNININKRVVGQTASKTFFRLELAPGLYNVESTAENVSALALKAEAGRTYYVWQEVKMGMWSARTQVTQVDDATGRAGVNECKLAAMSITGADIPPLDAAPSPAASSQVADKLRELQKMYDDRLISEQEYQRKRAELLQKF